MKCLCVFELCKQKFPFHSVFIENDQKIHFEPSEDKYLLAKDVTCMQDVKNLCKTVKKENNFAVFVCLQDAAHVR